MKPYLKYLLTPLFFAPLAHAEMRYVDAHVHGIGKLELAQEQHELSATLSMPGMDVVGFETIKTHEQEEQVEKALDQLKQADLVMVFNSEAQCKLHHASARLSNDDEGHDNHHSQEDHHGHGHESHQRHEESSKHHDEEESHHRSEHHSDHDSEHHSDHDSEHHSDHDSDHHSGHHHDGHHDSDGHEDNHFDIIAHYEFDCKHPEKLTELKLELFKQYPASETVRVQALTEKGAFAKDLSAKKPMLKLSHGQH